MYSKLTTATAHTDEFCCLDSKTAETHDPCQCEARRAKYEHDLRLAYCAGLFDGDGCIIISKQWQPGRKNASYRLTLSLVQNCNYTINHFRKVLDVQDCLVEVRRKAQHNRQVYDLRFDGLHAVAVLKLLSPYLVRKAIEAGVALDFWTAGSMGVLPGRNGLDPDVWVKREKFFRKMKKLK